VAACFFAGLVFRQLNFLNQLTRRSGETRAGAKGGLGTEAGDGAEHPGLVQTCSLKSPATRRLQPSLAPRKKVLCLLGAPCGGGSPAARLLFCKGQCCQSRDEQQGSAVGKEEYGDEEVGQLAQTMKKK